MNKFVIFLVFCLSSLVLMGCTQGKESKRVEPATAEDKSLTCEQLELEMNEAAYYAEQAERNKGLNARNVLWPFGYAATYLSAGQALKASQARIYYLREIHRIKDCDHKLFDNH